MKNKLFLSLISVVIIFLCGCSDDSQEAINPNAAKALTPAFWETYGFRAKDHWVYIPGTRIVNYNAPLIIPISGVLEYIAVR